MKIKWIFAVIFAVVLAVLFFAAKSVLQSRLNSKALQAQLSKSLGVNASFQRAHVAWNGEFELEELTLEEQSKAFLSAKSARMHLSFLDLFQGRIRLKSLSLQNPNLALDQNLAQTLYKIIHENKTENQSFPVAISHGLFSYVSQNGKSLSFHDIHGGLTLAPGKIPLKLKFQDHENGRYTLSGALTAQDLNLEGTLENVQLTEIISPLGINPIPEMQGKIDGRFTVAGQPGHLAIESQFTEKSGLFKGSATVTATLDSTSKQTVLKGKLYSDHGEIEGVGNFKSFGVNFATPSEGFVFQNGIIEFPSGPVKFSGAIEKNYSLIVNFKSQAFNPFLLSNFSGWGIRSSEGKIEGVVSGTFPHLLVKTTGTFGKVWIGENRLDHVNLNVHARLGSENVKIEKFAVHSNQASLSFVGQLHWDNERNLRLRVSKVDANEMARLFHLENELAPLRMMLSGITSYQKSTRTWTGNVESTPGVIAGEPFDQFYGQFSYQEKKPVVFSGTFVMAGRKAEVSGTWKNHQGTLKLDAAGFPLERLPGIKGTAKDFRGIADIHARFSTNKDEKSEVSFSLPRASYKGKSIPPLQGTVFVQGNVVSLSSVRLTRTTPPLEITGEYNLKSKQMHLVADLKGQDSAALLSFASASPIKMKGSLYGKGEVRGVYPDLGVRFNGEVRNVEFQDFAFDSGHLTVEGALPSHFKVNFQTNQFSLAKLPVIHHLVPDLEGTGTLSLSSSPLSSAPDKQWADVEVHLKQVSWKGKSYGGVEAKFNVHPPLITITRLQVPLTQPPLLVTGEVNTAGKKMQLRAHLEGQNIGDLAKEMGQPAGEAGGSLYGDLLITGFPPAVRLAFKGKGKNLRFSGMDLGEADLILQRLSSGTLDIRASRLSAQKVSMLQNTFPGLSGELQVHFTGSSLHLQNVDFQLTHGQWQGKAFPSLSGTLTMEGKSATFSRLALGGISPPLLVAGEVNSETHEFRFKSSLEGQKVADLAGLLALSILQVNGSLYGPLFVFGNSSSTTLSFLGTAKGLKFHDLSLGSGHLEVHANSDSQKHFALHVAAGEISAGSVRLLAQHFPGISGKLGFEVSLNTASPNQASLSFSLTHAFWKGKNFPELDGQGLWIAPRLKLSPVSLKGISPPLSMSGEYNTETEAIHLSGELDGQWISDLLILAGSTNSQANGRLVGPVAVSGSTASPQLSFHGRVGQLAYRGIQMGEGSLDLTASQTALNGKLILFNPVSLDPNDSLLSGLIQKLPGVGNIFGNLTSHVLITGAIIRGTPQNPEFAPTLERTVVRKAPNPQNSQREEPNPVVNILEQILRNKR